MHPADLLISHSAHLKKKIFTFYKKHSIVNIILLVSDACRGAPQLDLEISILEKNLTLTHDPVPLEKKFHLLQEMQCCE